MLPDGSTLFPQLVVPGFPTKLVPRNVSEVGLLGPAGAAERLSPSETDVMCAAQDQGSNFSMPPRWHSFQPAFGVRWMQSGSSMIPEPSQSWQEIAEELSFGPLAGGHHCDSTLQTPHLGGTNVDLEELFTKHCLRATCLFFMKSSIRNRPRLAYTQLFNSVSGGG